MTVSREHLKLRLEDGGWSVQAIAGNQSTLCSKPLAAGEAQRMPCGGCVTVGAVRLTFYQPDGFLKRLTDMPPTRS